MDGGKWVCGLSSLKKPCIVYSCGSQGDFSFEKAVHDRTGCEVRGVACTRACVRACMDVRASGSVCGCASVCILFAFLLARAASVLVILPSCLVFS